MNGNQNQQNSKNPKTIVLSIIIVVIVILLFTACSSSSSYQLHNKDGSLNMKYVDDMNDYFEKHPDKLP
jgi:ABC-type oligopeptide transport system substrate-binding subunit